MIARQHNLNNKDKPGEIVHVLEVPGCYFNGVQVCLLVKSRDEIPKCQHMVVRFKKWMCDQQSKSATGIIRVGGN